MSAETMVKQERLLHRAVSQMGEARQSRRRPLPAVRGGHHHFAAKLDREAMRSRSGQPRSSSGRSREGQGARGVCTIASSWSKRWRSIICRMRIREAHAGGPPLSACRT